MALDLHLVRHGETAWSRSGQHTGRTDLRLLPEGEEQAVRIGERLRGVPFAWVASSDRRRALRTAELAGFEQPEITPLLREFDYGEYEGRTSAEIRAERPSWQLWVDGCPGGESPAQVAARAAAFLDRLEGADGPALAFSHGHFMRALAMAWTGLDVSAAAHLGLGTGAICVLVAGDRGRVIERWNCSP